MRLTIRFRFLLLVAFSVPYFAIQAQSAQGGPQEMTIHVTADTRSGDPVPDLTQNDFTLLDNRKPEPITGFRALKDAQTSVIIVIDDVNLPYTVVSFARQQLANFLSANDGRLPQPTTIAVLQDEGVRMRPEFTTNGNDLRTTLNNFSIGLRDLRRSAGIYGADERLQLCLQAFNELASQKLPSGPTRIIWISGGWPLLSGPGVDLSPSQSKLVFDDVVALTTELHRSNITVDVVDPGGADVDVGRAFYYESFLHAPKSPRDAQIGDLGLQVIATQTGGLVLNGNNDISGLLHRVFDQTRGGYELTFTPAPGEHEDEYHQLDVKVRRPGVVVHTTSGYYAQPVSPSMPPFARTVSPR